MTKAVYTSCVLMGSPCALDARRRRVRGSAGFAGGPAGAGASAAFDALAAGFGVFNGAVAFCLAGSFGAAGLRASRTERRLVGPRTGVRSTNTHPTFGT